MRVGWIYATRLQGMLWGGFFLAKRKRKRKSRLFGYLVEFPNKKEEGRRKKEMGKGEEKKI
jgi:hypothetical protein